MKSLVARNTNIRFFTRMRSSMGHKIWEYGECFTAFVADKAMLFWMDTFVSV
jgi:hypothetical protein